MTAERDGKSRRTDQPDLLASLPDERPPASQPAPGIDPAMIEELLTGVRDLREQVCCSASPFDPPESKRFNVLPRRSASNLRALLSNSCLSS